MSGSIHKEQFSVCCTKTMNKDRVAKKWILSPVSTMHCPPLERSTIQRPLDDFYIIILTIFIILTEV
jgi:hypothetical protein